MDNLTLLQVLKDPSNPAFEQALAQLQNFNPATLKPQELTSFLAQLDDTIASITQTRDKTSQQLQNLRKQAFALTSYGSRK